MKITAAAEKDRAELESNLKEKADQEKAQKELLLDSINLLTDAVKELTWMIRQKF